MQKITIQYENFDGETVSEDLYFHLNVKEIQEMENWSPSLTERIAQISKTSDGQAVFNLIRDVIEAAYGERSEDGKRFVKNQQIKENLTQGLAYDELIVGLIDGSIDMDKFIKGLLPTKILALAKNSNENEKKDLENYLVEHNVDPEFAAKASEQFQKIGESQE
jgi:hypothetical protein|nr:MAG TPA: hypothetical protein [Caudoviricetes sp.]